MSKQDSKPAFFSLIFQAKTHSISGICCTFAKQKRLRPFWISTICRCAIFTQYIDRLRPFWISTICRSKVVSYYFSAAKTFLNFYWTTPPIISDNSLSTPCLRSMQLTLLQALCLMVFYQSEHKTINIPLWEKKQIWRTLGDKPKKGRNSNVSNPTYRTLLIPP